MPAKIIFQNRSQYLSHLDLKYLEEDGTAGQIGLPNPSSTYLGGEGRSQSDRLFHGTLHRSAGFERFGGQVGQALDALSLLVNGILLGVSVLIFPSVCEALPKGYAAAAIGIVNAAGCLAGGLLLFIPGLFMDGTKVQQLEVYQKILMVYLLAMIAATIAAFLMHETRPGWDNAVTPDNKNLDPHPRDLKLNAEVPRDQAQ